MRIKSNLARVAGGIAALAAGAIGIVGVGVAQASPSPDLEYGNIDFDPDREGSLTLHKYLNQHVTDPNAGPQGNAAGEVTGGDFTDPVEGVEFTVYPLTKNGQALDLEDPGVWDVLEDLTASQTGNTCEAPEGYGLGNAVDNGDTNADGFLEFTELDLGVYVVCETNVANAKVKGEGHVITQRALPIVVVLPTPYKDGWLYDVHAFPKNRGFAPITKTLLEQKGLTLGSEVKFELTMDVPSLPLNENWTQGAIADVYDSRLGVPDDPVESVFVGGTELVKGTDYTVVVRKTDDGNGRGAGVEFTETGLAKFKNNAYAGQAVKVILKATVEELGNGEINNQAAVWTDQDGFNLNNANWVDTEGQQMTSNTVSTNWGDALVFKYAKGTSPKKELAGAKFEVYPAATPYPGDDACGTDIAKDAEGNQVAPLSFEGQTQFTTDSTGTFRIPGLYVSDSEHQPYNSQYRCYVIKEVEAPAGYVTPSESAYTALKVQFGETTDAADVEISNSQQKVPSLPITGAAGKLLLMLAGIAAAAIVVGAVFVNKRKTKKVLG